MQYRILILIILCNITTFLHCMERELKRPRIITDEEEELLQQAPNIWLKLVRSLGDQAPDKERHYLELAALQEHNLSAQAMAWLGLGRFYSRRRRGPDVKKDTNKTRQYLELAALQEHNLEVQVKAQLLLKMLKKNNEEEVAIAVDTLNSLGSNIV